MPNIKNIAQTKELEEKIAKAKSIVFTNYSRMSVKQQTILRSELRKAGGEFIVAKNTLIARLLGKNQLKTSLQGQTGTLFSYEDEVKALKVLVKFSKDNTVPEVKEGIMNGELLTATQVMELSKLPGKEELIVMMLGRMNAPGSKLVGVLNAGVRDLVFALSAYQKKLSENPIATA